MPAFSHLHRRKIDFEKIISRVQAVRTFGVDYEFAVEHSADQARRQAEVVAADIVSMGGPIETDDVLTLESQSVALIAYLQRLGTDREPNPAPLTPGPSGDPAPADDRNAEREAS